MSNESDTNINAVAELVHCNVFNECSVGSRKRHELEVVGYAFCDVFEEHPELECIRLNWSPHCPFAYRTVDAKDY